MNQSLRNLIPDLLAIVYKAGISILDVYNAAIDVNYKHDRSPLTLADKNSNEIISRLLSSQLRPKMPILSEEGRDIPYPERKNWDCFWLVDPLDGTKEFIKRNGEFTVNIALIHEERPRLGVIYIPVKDTFYFAAENLGAYKMISRDTTKSSLSLDDILKKSRKLETNNSQSNQSNITIAGSRSHPSKELEDFIEVIKTRVDRVEFISAGSSLKFCLVAEGLADIYPRFGPTMEWDTAAGQVIVEQANGRVLNLETENCLTYNKEDLLNPWFIVGREELLSDLRSQMPLLFGSYANT
jgi:3'(2'), 5'-bisphosphate nucleotidase